MKMSYDNPLNVFKRTSNGFQFPLIFIESTRPTCINGQKAIIDWTFEEVAVGIVISEILYHDVSQRAKRVRLTYASPATRAWRGSCANIIARTMTGRVVEVKAVVRTTRLQQIAKVMRFFHRNSLNAHALVDGILKHQTRPSEFKQREARSLRFLQRIRICF